jgi:methionyl-tRNA synthetase
MARYQRLAGASTFFLTGSDEHGHKIAAAAAAAGETPQGLCDRVVASFVRLYGALNISYNGFIRTTSEAHKRVAQNVFRRARAAGDIYLGQYSGWYNVRLETFVPETEAQNANFTDTLSGAPLQRVEEESYFFNLSKYQERLLEHIERHPEFVQPAAARNEILQRLQEPLRDLSVSRTTFNWGVPVPDDETGKHVLYVWFDALTNYLSGSNNPVAEAAGGENTLTQGAAWPAALQVVGKDIVWFHAVIWPAMLWSIGEALPQRIFAHGFVTDAEGRKMSKSLGNVVEPPALLEAYGADSLRYALTCAAPWGHDVPFRLCFSKVSSLAVLYGKCTRALTCENFCF